MLHDIEGKIFLIVDRHSAHTAAETTRYVASTEGRLRLFYLPPYSPELNPDEWVWKNVKHDHVGKIIARTRDELKDGVLSETRLAAGITAGQRRDDSSF